MFCFIVLKGHHGMPIFAHQEDLYQLQATISGLGLSLFLSFLSNFSLVWGCTTVHLITCNISSLQFM